MVAQVPIIAQFDSTLDILNYILSQILLNS